LNGCIIDATRCNGVEVPMSFDTDAAAVRYFAELLKAHSSWIKQEEKEEKEKRKREKKLKRINPKISVCNLEDIFNPQKEEGEHGMPKYR